MEYKVNALVPMKDHSERVPGKNIRPFCGMPLFCRIIGTLARSRHIEKIYVNTDSEKIKQLMREFDKNVVIIDRPEPLKGDFVSMNALIEYDMGLIKGGHFLQTHSTNPLLTTDTVDNAIRAYFDKRGEGHDSLFGVDRHQARFYDSNFKPVNHNIGELLRTQDLPPMYKDNSCLYIFSRSSFEDNGRNRIGRNPFLFEIGKVESIDIDTEEEFIMAEKMCMARDGKAGRV